MGRTAAILAVPEKDLEALGQGIPAVENDVARLRGTLRSLATQFADLEVGAR